MIDEEWLRTLRFDLPGVGTVTGLAGVGSQFVALTYTDLEGQLMVMKSLRRSLAWHLKEVPRELGWTEGHSTDRVNRKLLAAAGSPVLDENCFFYNRVFNIALGQLLKRSSEGRLAQSDEEGGADPLSYLVQTDVFSRRIQDILSRPAADSPFGSAGTEYFGELFPPDTRQRIAELTPTLEKWRAEPEMVAIHTELAPHEVSRNPLFVWGAAVMEEMIVGDEFEAVASFVKDRFPEMRAPVNDLPMKGSDWFDVLFYYVDEEIRDRLVAFAGHFGFKYEFAPDTT